MIIKPLTISSYQTLEKQSLYMNGLYCDDGLLIVIKTFFKNNRPIEKIYNKII